MLSLASRSFIACTATILLVSTGLSQQAVSARSVSYELNIPSEPLDAALQALALASHHKLLYRAELVAGKASPALIGTYTTEQAVTRLLEGTQLSFEITPASVVLIKGPDDKTIAARATAPVSAPDDQSTKKETGNKSSQDFRLAQVDKGQTAGDNSVNNQDVKTSDSTKPEESKGLAEILVRGSRTMNIDVVRTEDDPQPYYIFDSEVIKQSGATNLEDFLKQRLTMETTFQSNSQQIGTAGTTSSINLRGLGTNETLVLINGRRSAGVTLNGSFGGQPDINGIPVSAIERIEVLPSSASAIYGGAAVGGVVNIILKQHFNGGEINAKYENVTQGDAPLRSIAGTYGVSLDGGKTQVMVTGSYADSKDLLLQDRLSLLQRGEGAILRNNPSFLYDPFNPFPGGTTPNIANADFSNYPTPSNLTLRNGTSLNSPITSIPAGAAPGSDLSAGLLANAGKYNLNSAPGTGRYGLQRPIGSVPTTESLMMTVRQELNPLFDVFADASWNKNSSNAQVNPLAFPWSVPASAPTNPFTSDVTVSAPQTTLAPLTTESETIGATVGAVAHLPAGWNSEFDYTWSKNRFHYTNPQADFTAFFADLANGNINPFVDTIAHPIDLTPYIANERQSSDTTLNDLGLRASGPLPTFPWGTPTLTVGLEHRKEGSHATSETVNYPLTPASDFNGLFLGQSQSTNSVYLEALVPLVTSKNAVPLVRSVELQLAGRAERYTVNVQTGGVSLAPDGSLAPGTSIVHSVSRYTSTNPTIALKYKPLEDWTIRVSYARAFLPPTPSQLLPDPTQYTGYTITDPKNGERYPVSVTFGGNPALRPQTSRNWDFGLIWKPQDSFLQGLRANVEYYEITQPDYITSATQQDIVNNPAYADRVTRDPTTGRITLVDDSPVNATEYKTSGWDFSLEYRIPTDFGNFELRGVGTVIASDKRQLTYGGPSYEYAGFPGDGGEVKTKANVSLIWDYRRLLLGWTTTYFGSYTQSGAPGSPNGIQTDLLGFAASPLPAAQGSNTIRSQIYHSIFGSFDLGSNSGGSSLRRELFSNWRLQFGIKNLFNSSPPLDVSTFYYYSTYGDPRLRDYWVSIRKAF